MTSNVDRIEQCMEIIMLMANDVRKSLSRNMTEDQRRESRKISARITKRIRSERLSEGDIKNIDAFMTVIQSTMLENFLEQSNSRD